MSFGFAAEAQVNDKPLTEGWAPTEWGADDKVGAANRTTPAIVPAPIAFTDEAVVVGGRLEMLEDSLSGSFYRLHDAVPVAVPEA